MCELVSILMSTYREPLEYIKQSIDSILCQTYKNIEFIIIIDDPTNEKNISLIQQYANNDQRIKVYVNEANQGLVESLNRGISYCDGEYIARMDADDISKSNRIEMQLQFLCEKKLDLVGAAIHYLREKTNKTYDLYFPESNDLCAEQLKSGTCSPHPTWLGKKEVFLKLHGYRNISFCEDYDFLIRAAELGFSLGNVQEVLLKYRIRENSISTSNPFQQQAIAEFLRNTYKNKVQLTIEMYDSYIRSEKFQSDVVFFSKCSKNNEIKSGRAKCLSVLKLFFNVRYLKIWLQHRKYNHVKWVKTIDV